MTTIYKVPYENDKIGIFEKLEDSIEFAKLFKSEYIIITHEHVYALGELIKKEKENKK